MYFEDALARDDDMRADLEVELQADGAFDYPADWELEVTDHGQVVTVAVQAPGGLGFALITTDESRPDPADVADAALEAMREEYPDLDAELKERFLKHAKQREAELLAAFRGQGPAPAGQGRPTRGVAVMAG